MESSSGEPSPETNEDAAASSPLIPGLPDDVAELCLLHLPFPHRPLARSVSSSWNKSLKTLTLTLNCHHFPYLFVLSSRQNRNQLHFHAFDSRSKNWLLLPPPPPFSAGSVPVCPSAPASAAISGKGEIFLLGGMRSDDGEVFNTVSCYQVSTNSWSARAPMGAKRSFFAAGAVKGSVFVAGGGEGEESVVVEKYETVTDRWAPASPMRCGISRYDGAVVGTKMLVTEGWTWPFTFSPRAGVYDAERDIWEEMSIGLREGWTGVSAVIGTTLFVVSEYGEGRVKVYDSESDTWTSVSGSGVPSEVRKPYAVSGAEEGKIYVVGKGLDVGMGTLVEEKGKCWSVQWEVVKGATSLLDLAPCNSHVLYA